MYEYVQILIVLAAFLMFGALVVAGLMFQRNRSTRPRTPSRSRKQREAQEHQL